MEQWAGGIVFAHGGGKMDPRVATLFGLCALSLGGFLILKSGFTRIANRRFDVGLIYVGMVILAFGYVFLASGQNLPGGAVAFQAFAWLVELPLMFVPYFLWRLWRTEERKAAQDPDSSETPAEVDSSFLDAESVVAPLLQPQETILWCDRPWLRHFLGEMWAAFLLGVAVTSVGVVVLSLLAWSLVYEGGKWEALPGYLAGFAAGAFFIGLGVYLLQSPWRGPVRLRQVIYALTDRRALVLTGREVLWNPVPGRQWGLTLMEFGPEVIQARQRRKVGLSRYDWVLLQETVGGGKKRTTNRYGFLGLEHPEVVGDVMDRHYPLLAPASSEPALVPTPKPRVK